MKAAVGSVLLAAAFLGSILAGVGARDEPSLAAPAVIRIRADSDPTSGPPVRPTPGVERIERSVEYGDISEYEEDRRGSNSGPSENSGSDADNSGPGSDDSGSDNSGPGSSGSGSSGEGS